VPTSRDFRDVGPADEHLGLNHGGEICSSRGIPRLPTTGKHGAPTSLSSFFVLRVKPGDVATRPSSYPPFAKYAKDGAPEAVCSLKAGLPATYEFNFYFSF
jgi:hypothetical protein